MWIGGRGGRCSPTLGEKMEEPSSGSDPGGGGPPPFGLTHESRVSGRRAGQGTRHDVNAAVIGGSK
jgi:hypothetical protein